MKEFDLDSDELDDADHSIISQFHLEGSERHGDQRMPLLIGLADSARRPSNEGSFDRPGILSSGVDLEFDPSPSGKASGGNMVDSVANMANSILGAGEFLISPYGFNEFIIL